MTKTVDVKRNMNSHMLSEAKLPDMKHLVFMCLHSFEKFLGMVSHRLVLPDHGSSKTATTYLRDRNRNLYKQLTAWLIDSRILITHGSSKTDKAHILNRKGNECNCMTDWKWDENETGNSWLVAWLTEQCWELMISVKIPVNSWGMDLICLISVQCRAEDCFTYRTQMELKQMYGWLSKLSYWETKKRQNITCP